MDGQRFPETTTAERQESVDAGKRREERRQLLHAMLREEEELKEVV